MRAVVSRAVHELACRTGLSARLARRGRRMRVLMYHGVGDGLFAADALDRHLAYLDRHFEVVSLHEVVRRMESPELVTGREVALTFDDGLRNNLEVAWPVLRRHDAPATFFVCPGLADDGRWLWNHELRARLGHLAEARRAPLLRELGLGLDEPSTDDVFHAGERAKRLAPAERRAVEDAVRAATPDFEPTDVLRRRYDLLDWDEIRALDRDRITIGSHTLTHPILTTLPDADLDAEIEGSRRRLEEELDRDVDLFCYPNGAGDDRVHARVAAVYRAAVTTVPGTVAPRQDPHRVPRVGAPDATATLAWRLHRP